MKIQQKQKKNNYQTGIKRHNENLEEKQKFRPCVMQMHFNSFIH